MTLSYIERIRGARPESAVVVAINTTRREAHEGIHPYAAAAIGAELDRLDNLPRPWSPNSYWDQTTFDVACNLIEIANAPWSGYTVADAERDLFAHAPADTSWGRREHEKKWESALDRVGATSRPEPAPRDEWVVPDATVLQEEFLAAAVSVIDEPDPATVVRERFPLLDFIELLGTDDEGEEWIVEPILPARRLVALYSAPKVGKSLLMLEIAVSIALGREVLGVTPEPRKVLYVDFENDPRGDVKRRLEAMGFGVDDGPALNEGLCYLSFPTMAKLDTPQGGFEILTTAQIYGCEVVVIDTVSRAVGGEENDNDTWLAFYRNTGMQLKGAGIACLRLDHSGKDAEKGMRGGSAKYGDVDAVWKLTAESETVLELVCTDHRMPIEYDRLTVIRDTSPVLRHRAIGDRSVALDARESEIDKAIDDLGLPANVGNRIAKKALRDAGYKFNNPAIEKVIKSRKLRLDQRSPGTSGERSPAPDAPPPSPASLKGAGAGNVGTVPGTVDDDQAPPMFIVACKRCYTPVDRDEAHAAGGYCPKCQRETGVVS